MKSPYLLQRIKFKAGDTKIAYDYMGSAEFEFGEIPKCYRRMSAKKDEIGVFPVVDLNGKSIAASNGLRLYFVGTVDTLSTIQHDYIPNLLADKHRLKERSELRCQLTGMTDTVTKHKYWTETANNGVLDIENDYFLIWGEKSAHALLTYFNTVLTEKFSNKKEGKS